MSDMIRYVILVLAIKIASFSPAQVVPVPGAVDPVRSDSLPNAMIGAEGIRDAAFAWERLDVAREEFMQGKAPAALVILEDLASDTTAIDTNFINARRELTAFVLAAQGEHQRAFDSLQLFVSGRLRLIEQEGAMREDGLAAQIKDLERKLVVQDQEARTREEHLRNDHDDYFIISVILIALLLLISILLAIKAVKRSRARTVIPAPIVQASDEPGPIGQQETTVPILMEAPHIDPAEPMDPRVLLAHTEHISGQLNKGATVEAAGHLGVLNRFLKIMVEEQDQFIPAQNALALFRQFMKLEVLRANMRVKYSVDADRSLIDAGALVPAANMLHSLSYGLHSAAASHATMLNVELVPNPSGNGSQCLISHPVASAESDASNIAIGSHKELKISGAIEAGRKVIRIHWIAPTTVEN